MTSLHKAAEHGHLAEIKSLTQNGADVYAKSEKYGELPMHLSAIKGHTDCVKYFLELGVGVNVCNKIGLTCAHLAAYENHLETLKMLIRKDANIEARCLKYGTRPVDGAAYRGQFECVEHLINSGSTLNSLSLKGRSVLSNAADGRHLKIIKFLVERGADLDVREKKNDNHSIHFAALGGHKDCLEYFLDLDIDVDLFNKHGNTSIMTAAVRGDLEIIKLLILHGAYIDRTEWITGNTALHFASQHGHYECVKFLIHHKASTEIWNKFEKTPRDLAVVNGHTATAGLLGITRCKKIE